MSFKLPNVLTFVKTQGRWVGEKKRSFDRFPLVGWIVLLPLWRRMRKLFSLLSKTARRHVGRRRFRVTDRLMLLGNEGINTRSQ